MLQKYVSLLLLMGWTLAVVPAFAEDGVKVVPIGDTIKPDSGGGGGGGGKKAPAKKKPRPVVVQAGEGFPIELATAMSSGLTKQGETVYFRAMDDVGPSSRPVIMRGSVGEGRVMTLDNNKKQGKIVVELNTVESASGDTVTVNGNIEVIGDKGPASVAFGERFNASLEQKITAKRRPKGEPTSLAFKYRGLAEVSGKGVKTDIKKGISKGKVQVLIEPPSGMSPDDVDSSYLVLYKVNDFEIPAEVPALPGKPKVGDKNKNGTKDLSYEFDGWTFVKYQPRGQNNVSFKGKMRDGTPFEAPARVTIDY